MAVPFPVAMDGTAGRRLRLLLCSNGEQRGGAEEHMLLLLRGLDRAHFELHVACPARLLRELPELPGDVGVHAGAPRAPWSWREGRRLAAYVRQAGIEAVHFHLASSSRAGAAWVRWGGAAVVLETPHLREAWRRGWKRSYWLDRRLDRLLDAYIAVSTANASYLRNQKRLPPDKIWTIPNGIDLTRFRRRPPLGSDPRARFGIGHSELVVVCAARLEPQKGHAVLLAAFARLAHAAGPPLRLVCLGEGSLEARLAQQAEQLGIADRVIFTGYSRQIESWLAAADLFVLPSLYEGLPLAAIEAAAAGCPIVATAVDGTPEAVNDGYNGLLVPPGDAEALAQAMRRLLADPELRLRLGENGRAQALRFDQQKQVAATASLYFILRRIHAGGEDAAASARRTA